MLGISPIHPVLLSTDLAATRGFYPDRMELAGSDPRYPRVPFVPDANGEIDVAAWARRAQWGRVMGRDSDGASRTPSRSGVATARGLWRRAALPALAVTLAACAAGGSTQAPPSAEPTAAIATTNVSPASTAPSPSAAPTPAAPTPAAPTPTATPTGPFHSALYGYAVTSPDWTGIAATTAWDGTGSPGDDDPFVDLLTGPIPHTFAYGASTTATLDAFAAASRATGATELGCPKPDATTKLKIGGAPALLDSGSCNGVFVLTAYVVRAGRADVFVMYDQPGSEAADRAGFEGLLHAVSFTP